jgi:hypothetical protein
MAKGANGDGDGSLTADATPKPAVSKEGSMPNGNGDVATREISTETRGGADVETATAAVAAEGSTASDTDSSDDDLDAALSSILKKATPKKEVSMWYDGCLPLKPDLVDGSSDCNARTNINFDINFVLQWKFTIAPILH